MFPYAAGGGQTTSAAEHFWEQEVALPVPAGSGAARTGGGCSPAWRTEGAGLQTDSKAEQERERLYLNRLTAASLLHIDYKANLVHAGKKDLSGPSSSVCPSPSATHGGAADGLKANVAETLRVIPCSSAQRSTRTRNVSMAALCPPVHPLPHAAPSSGTGKKVL